MNADEYKCKRCNEIWGFCPEDYEYKSEHYPVTCPFCNMPITQLIHDVYLNDGMVETLKRLWIRLKTWQG